MNEARSQWEIWCEQTDAAFSHCMDLMWMRQMWKTTDMILVDSEAPSSRTIQNHMTSTYVFAICTLVRRETDLSSSTGSLARQLTVLRDTGGLIDRSSFAGSDAEFDRFAQPNSELIDPEMIRADVAFLRRIAKPVKTYTDKVIAHRERFGRDAPPLRLEFSEIDGALAAIGVVIEKYWCLVHPGAMLARTTPVDDRGWYKSLTVPWIKAGQTFDEIAPPRLPSQANT